MKRHLVVLTVLAATQLVGWGSVSVLPVLAPRIAADLNSDITTIFAGSTAMFVAMGIAAPLAGRGFRRYGARRLMAVGAAIIGCSLGLVGSATSVPVLLLAWAAAGAGGALFLTTAAYVYIAEYSDRRARTLIGTLMLATGPAGSVFWPVTAYLDHLVGWRATLFIYSGAMLTFVVPLALFALPRTAAQPAAEVASTQARRRGLIFVIVLAAVSTNSFVTFGVEAVGIELLRSMGADLSDAVAIASLLGVAKVAGRLIDLAGGERWDGLTTAVVAGAAIPIGVAVLAVGGVEIGHLIGYVVIFGLGSGAFAVARATMPLVFFGKTDYAAAMSGIALPLNFINALAPPSLAALMTSFGPKATFGLLGCLSAAAFVMLLALTMLRPRPPRSDGETRAG